MTTDDLERWRTEFPILASTVYMISNSLGAMPRRTAESLAEYAHTWATRGVRAWEERWWEMAREVGDQGALVLLDGYQSAGIIPLDVTALGVDFFAGGCLKWLCGGPGTAFLYTRPDLLRTARPRFTGWFSHRSPFAFDTGPVDPRGDA